MEYLGFKLVNKKAKYDKIRNLYVHKKQETIELQDSVDISYIKSIYASPNLHLSCKFKLMNKQLRWTHVDHVYAILNYGNMIISNELSAMNYH